MKNKSNIEDVSIVNFSKINKRGSEKYYIIISLILGLMVLALGLFFIFGEYFTKEELDWQQCRQSIILRTNMPNLNELGTDLKGAFPLKCKTEVVTIDSSDPEEVYGKISEAIAEGWYMFGAGEFDFIHREFLGAQRYCLVFARLHFDSESVEKFDKELASSSDAEADKIKFHQGFSDYYLKTNIPGQQGTYNKYLPILGSGEPAPRLIINSKVYPQNEDIALVYVLNKYATVSKALNYIPAVWLASKIITGKSPSELIALMEKFNFVEIVSTGDLDNIGCTKFLTIPA